MSLSITELTLVLIAWWFLTALYVFATGLVGNWVGLSLKYLSIGMGPILYSFGFLGGRVNLRPMIRVSVPLRGFSGLRRASSILRSVTPQVSVPLRGFSGLRQS